MEIKDYPKHLELLANNKFIRQYINERSKATLHQQASDLASSLNKNEDEPQWCISIPRESPFEFIPNDGLQVDISFIIEGKGNKIVKQNLEMRVWSLKKNLSYREKLDSDRIREELQYFNWKRVISRFHFDLRNDNSILPEPICHLQVGGDSGDCLKNAGNIKENCWHPKKVAIPRFFHLPVDIIMICELVLVNFFPKETEDFRKRREWINLVKKSEELFCRSTFEKYIRCFEDKNQTLLGNLIT
jgi:hypothetical protein